MNKWYESNHLLRIQSKYTLKRIHCHHYTLLLPCALAMCHRNRDDVHAWERWQAHLVLVVSSAGQQYCSTYCNARPRRRWPRCRCFKPLLVHYLLSIAILCHLVTNYAATRTSRVIQWGHCAQALRDVSYFVVKGSRITRRALAVYSRARYEYSTPKLAQSYS